MITVPTRSTIMAQVVANLKSVRPQVDTSKGSPEWARINTVVEALYGLYWNIRAVQQDIWPSPDTPTDSLEKHADLRLGPDGRRSASLAAGSSAVRVTGVATTAAVTAGLALVADDGTRFQLKAGATVGVGTSDLDIEALTAGAAGNKSSGDTLVFEAPPANIQAEVTLVADLSGGLDAETDAELLERVIHAYRNPPAGGRFSDYWAWALSVVGVGGAYTYGPSSYAVNGRRGLGVVDTAITAVGSGADRIPSAALVRAVQDTIDAVRPIQAKDTLAIACRALSQDVDVQLDPAQGYEWDWDADVGGHTVSSYLAQVIDFGAALPASLMAAVDVGASCRLFCAGQVFNVASYNAVAQTVTISETPTTDPVPGDDIYPGGPLSVPALAAVKDHFDSLGPARDTYADPNQWWEDTLRVNKLPALMVYRLLADGTVAGVEGCNDASVVTPVANVAPADDLVLGPQLIVPGTITVRPT